MGRQKRKAPELLSELLAGSDAEQGHKEKLKKYAGAKAHAQSVASYILTNEPALFKEAELLEACSAWLIFRHFYTMDKYRLIGGCTCKKHLLCAMCALRRSAKTVMVYAAKIKAVIGEHHGLVPVLLTLTVKNGDDLEERTNHLEYAFKRMIDSRRRAKSGSRHQTVFRFIHGAAGAFEFKRGKNSGLWHPHVHLFALVPSDVDLMDMQWQMSEEWRNLTRDSHNVDITPIDWTTEESQMKAVCEVFRYALKFGEMDISDQVHAYKVLQGRRLVRDFGSLHGVKVPDDLHDTIEDELKLSPYVDMMYQYSVNQGYLLQAVCDTGDTYTGSIAPHKSEDQKKLRRIAGAKHNIFTLDHVKNWTKRQKIEAQLPEEAPF